MQVTGKAKKIPAGEYRLSGNLGLFKLVDELTKGPAEIWVTIPEGLRKEEVAQKFTQGLGRDNEFKEEFCRHRPKWKAFFFQIHIFSRKRQVPPRWLRKCA